MSERNNEGRREDSRGRRSDSHGSNRRDSRGSDRDDRRGSNRGGRREWHNDRQDRQGRGEWKPRGRITVADAVMTDRVNHVEIGVTIVTVAMTDGTAAEMIVGTVETVVISRAASARTVEIGSHVENTVVMIDATTVAGTVTGVAVVGTKIVMIETIGAVAVLGVTIAGMMIVVTRVAVHAGRTEAVGQSKNAIAAA